MPTPDDVVTLVDARHIPLMVGIDRLPVSGRTTLVPRLMDELGVNHFRRGDFLKPETERPLRNTPSFPCNHVLLDNIRPAADVRTPHSIGSS